jgi:hypothetical protein
MKMRFYHQSDSFRKLGYLRGVLIPLKRLHAWPHDFACVSELALLPACLFPNTLWVP